MKTILLHVGTHKTGSTTLQSTFDENRDLLKRMGIEYLGGKRAYPCLYSSFLTNPMNHSWNTLLSGLTEADIRARDKAARGELIRLIEASQSDTIIISSEFLSMLDQNEQKALRAFLEPHGRVIAVYYYRDLLSWMSSDSQQMAKAGWNHQPTAYKIAVERIHKMPLRVHAVFGAKNTKFIRFEEAVNVGICDSFLTAFDLPTLASQGVSELHSNEAISANAVQAMYLYNRLFPRGSGQRSPKIVEQLQNLEGPKYVLSGISKNQIRDYTKKRAEVSKKLGLLLAPAEDFAVCDNPDPMNDALLKMVNKYIRNGKGGAQ